MARRVFFHVGILKTGTTYLQRVMWHNRSELRHAGLLVVGDHYLDRVWATHTIRQMSFPHERAASAWQRIVRQVQAFDGDAVISHEFLGGAGPSQVQRALDAVAPAEVHIVCTARDLTRVLPAFWQERVKFGHTVPFEDYEPEPLDSPPRRHWSWRTIDLADVLRRWGKGLPPEHVHVITTPTAGAPRGQLWERFAGVCGVDPGVARLDNIPPVNVSMGLAETELLRRLNERLPGEMKKVGVVGRWLRTYLGEEVLASRDGERLRLDPQRAMQIRARSVQTVNEIREAGYHVVGDLDDLVGSEPLQPVRMPRDVSDGELLDVALTVISRMLVDQRAVSESRDRLRRRLRERGARRMARRLVRRVRDSRSTLRHRSVH